MRTFSHWRLGIKVVIACLGLFCGLMIVTAAAFTLAYWQRILPGVQINDIKAGNMTAEELAVAVDSQINSKLVLKVRYQDKEWVAGADEIGLSWNTPETVNQAWYVGRQGNLIERVGQAWRSFFEGHRLNIAVNEDGEKLDGWIETVATEVDTPLVKPSLNLSNKKIVFITGKDGLAVDRPGLKQMLRGRAERMSEVVVELPVSRQTVAISDDQVKKARDEAEKLIGKKLVFRLDDEKWSWNDEQLVRMVSVLKGEGFDETKVTEETLLLARGINRQPQNAALQFSEGKVSIFRPGKDGVVVENLELVNRIVDSYGALVKEPVVELEVAVKRTSPQIATGDVNDLGIKELLGVGKSTYQHSIPNRIHNVALAASRINGVLVPPGGEFSFNENVGDISQATGYLSAYVIQNGRTVLGDGGGVCQVSTTVFRAALDAGLPITDRKAHAYRVGYYEQDSLPGIDATVYSPTADLKFKNDTPGHLLIQTVTDSNTQKMRVEIYGTSDDRKSVVTKPKVWDQSPPPPTLYQDDPTLNVGVTKQVDWAAAGAKVSFDYVVTRDGQEIFKRTFFSNYRPWQAVYLKGTKI